MFQARAPYLFEPILAVHAPQLTILLSPVNLALGGLLAGLVGLNLAAAVLLPFVLPLRAVFYPLSLLLLAATLVWGTRFSATSRA